ncbi:type II secretion system minor pseudopilin GspH [Microbulbifer yueqingensis]|uniref:Type II secretion system protein H n=1 Tax=Microbulbifer yueqingensis TaxID=658219 RepID=A0A1G8ZYC2_9GAMM|nr:type II secretion system minor pseudopilin GspH [Microbulbifer yueqingensis]SDK20126.1 general secretion pathway protein H [Microbulbifer yueqingensis]
MRSRLSHSRGFTLIELLVVIVIIATLAGMAVLSLGGAGDRVWAGEVQRFAGLLRLVADRAVIDKAHYGVRVERHGYTVMRFDPETLRWQGLDSVGTGSAARRFAEHRLPDNIRLEVLEEPEMPGAGASAFSPGDGKEGQDEIPQFVALSSGEVLPVEMAMVLVEDGDSARAATISYSSLRGLELEWQSDEF